jgi:ubiquinone/menaquinone biosynthesis C-methylase UbiE
MKKSELKNEVKKHYAEIARRGGSCCGPTTSCCGTPAKQTTTFDSIGTTLGYSEQDISSVPDGSNLGLGCGNPLALASIHEGETVLDLGSGAGFDCFLAAQQVGDSGHVIGVDMTSEMIEKARKNALRANFRNVEFRYGEIENLPVENDSIDTVISNCVINLSPDKSGVFREAYRVLKPGGKLMVSDIVLNGKLPPQVLQSAAAYVACISGALPKEEYISEIEGAGFIHIEVVTEKAFDVDFEESIKKVELEGQESRFQEESSQQIAGKVASISVSAVKPA